MRVVLVDPPAFTPPYDHELAAALARAGAEVELLTSRFRFGERPAPDGYRLVESLYTRSSGVRRDAVRLPLKVLEHPLATRKALARSADVVHFQWLAVPELDRLLLRSGRPLVFTAHDLLPRRTAHHAGLWRALFARFEAIAARAFPWRAIPAEFGVDGYVCRYERHVIYWKLLADGTVGIASILHERMHQIERFREAFEG